MAGEAAQAASRPSLAGPRGDSLDRSPRGCELEFMSRKVAPCLELRAPSLRLPDDEWFACLAPRRRRSWLPTLDLWVRMVLAPACARARRRGAFRRHLGRELCIPGPC